MQERDRDLPQPADESAPPEPGRSAPEGSAPSPPQRSVSSTMGSGPLPTRSGLPPEGSESLHEVSEPLLEENEPTKQRNSPREERAKAVPTLAAPSSLGTLAPAPRGGRGRQPRPLLDPPLLRRALRGALGKMHPRELARNPVMLVVEVGSVATTVLAIAEVASGGAEQGFVLQVAFWLWSTVVFACFAESLAEARGKAQADALRKTRTETRARRLLPGGGLGLGGQTDHQEKGWLQHGIEEVVEASQLRQGDRVRCLPGDIIPGDGEVVEGLASVDESAITGESAPVVRESGGDRSAVTGGTRVLSDAIVVRITANPGETFLDRMIGLVEGAQRQKTPNELALHCLLAGLTIVFVLAVGTLLPYARYAVQLSGRGTPPSLTALVALLVCLAPTTIGGLLSAIGIAGMDRVMQHNVLATSGKAVEAAGDVNTLLLDKTGTITLGNRQAVELIPSAGVAETDLAQAAQLASLADETPEGRSIVVLAKERYGLRGVDLGAYQARFVPFTAHTRMSGVHVYGRQVMKGAADAVVAWVSRQGGVVPADLLAVVERVAREGGTPLMVAVDAQPLGVIYLKDVIKGGLRERFAQLRALGIKTVMITGDNALTAAAIAREAGVDEFLAEATPEAKMALIRAEQAGGKLVAMTGDGTNDAPALAQADVGLAMNSGTTEAKEAGNLVDLDSNPTKLIELVEIGKQLLVTRGALTTFSLANDVAKYFAILPAVFVGIYPELGVLNIMHLHSPQSAILASVIFNALVLVALIPLALRGVAYRPSDGVGMLVYNLLVFGVGGLLAPFPGIWLCDRLLGWLHLA